MKSTRRGALVLTFFGALAALLHVRAGHTFPVPWPDEIDFLTPAAAFAHHGSLRVPDLAAPAGIYWVSDIYYFVLAPFLRVLPATVDVGRAVSFGAILLAAAGFWTALRKAKVDPVPAAVVAGVWMLMPRVVLAGNLVRHEALILACVAWALAATLHRRRVGAIAIAAFAVLLHPAGVPFAVVIGLVNLRRPHGIRRWEWVAVGIVGSLLAFEVVHFASNWAVASEHLRFQADRKAGRGGPGTVVLALLLVAAGAVFARRRSDDENISRSIFIALGLAACSIALIGQEMWYEVYWFDTAPLLIASSLLVMWRQNFTVRRFAIVATATASVGLQGYLTPFYGMHFGADQREWNAFVADVEQQLHVLDAQTDRPITVAVSSLSGLPWPAKEHRIGNVTLVKETPVSAAASPDYTLFARTICCKGKGPIPATLGTVITSIESPHDLFDATLFKTEEDSVSSNQLGQLLP